MASELDSGASSVSTAKRLRCVHEGSLHTHVQHFWLPVEAEQDQASDKDRDDVEPVDTMKRQTLAVTVICDVNGTVFSGVGAKLWPAGCILAQLLVSPLALGSSWSQVLSVGSRPLRVLELGAGVAVPSICLASRGHTVVATDLPQVIPLTRMNIEANDCCTGKASATQLTWGDAAAANALGTFDLVIGSDLSYDPALYDPLVTTLLSLNFTHALLAAVCRSDLLGEETFENYCRDEGFQLALRYTELPRGEGARRVNVYEIDAAQLQSRESGEQTVRTTQACSAWFGESDM